MKSYCYFLLLGLLLGMGLPVCAQNLTLTGTVRTSTGEPLPGATVVLKGTYLGSSTDNAGRFSVQTTASHLPGVLVVSFVGYETQEVPATGAGQALTVTLPPASTRINEVVVSASRVEESIQRAPVTVEKLNEVQIRRATSPDLLASLAQYKGIDANASGILNNSLSTRGFNSATSERLIQLVDYMDTQSPSLNYNIGNTLGLPELDLASVEVVHGPASALYGANAFNGVVLSTSKDPFQDPGLSLRVRGGERAYFDGQFRYAQRLGQRFAFKLVGSYFTANDFIAENFDAQRPSPLAPVNNPAGSPLGYDAVNRYGDVGFTFPLPDPRNPLDPNRLNALAGQTVFTPGWTERDLIAGDTKARLYRILPSVSFLVTDKVKATLEFKRAQGTAGLQTIARYRMKNFATNQFRAELKSDQWFVRAYQTQDFGNDSYDLSNLGLYMQLSPDPRQLGPDGRPRRNPDGTPVTYAQTYFEQYAVAYNTFLALNPGNTSGAAEAARAAATATQLAPGSPEYNALRRTIVVDTTPGRGARVDASSYLRDVSGQYNFRPGFANIVVGAAYREFRLGSDGQLFSDVPGGRRIRNYEYGAYTQVSRELLADGRLKLAVAARLDRFRNFNSTFSPRASAVYSLGASKQHNFRASYGRAFRSPTQIDQYTRIDVGRAVVLGNIGGGFRGYSPAVFGSLNEVFANPAAAEAVLNRFAVRVQPLRPEEVNTYEAGYKAQLGDKLVVDVNYYFSNYTNFVGAAQFVGNTDGSQPTAAQFVQAILSPQPLQNRDLPTRIIQTSTNLPEKVRTQGSTVGLTYSAAKAAVLSANYTYNRLNRGSLPENFITFFNTPEHKYNLGVSGTVLNTLNYGFNYRWSQGYRFESPFATGDLRAYSSVDGRVGYTLPKLRTTLEIGGSNLFNSRNVQVYGAPQIGRLVYAGVVVDVK